jgi:hypothetical protein
MHRTHTPSLTRGSRRLTAALLVLALASATSMLSAAPSFAVGSGASPGTAVMAASTAESGSLESAAKKAGETGRKVAMSLIALGFALASIVLAFRRDFKEAAGIFAVGLVAILLATPAGVSVLHDTVTSLFGVS